MNPAKPNPFEPSLVSCVALNTGRTPQVEATMRPLSMNRGDLYWLPEEPSTSMGNAISWLGDAVRRSFVPRIQAPPA
jgi:hypothetical protein